jgi:replicative DNA helicase|tara:strand:+ start:2160 stop:3560 length:1401 start_codon:yes stop_codon:yes gene_type:complete
MSEKKVTLGYLGYKFQQELINQLMHVANKKFSDRIIDIIHAKYFDNEYFRLVIVTIKDYYDRFEKVPEWDTLETILKMEIKDSVTRDYIFAITKEIRDLQVSDWKFIQEKALNFCRQQELKKANDKINSIIDNGDFDNYEQCSEILKEALSIGSEKDDGVLITDDFESVLLDDYRNPIPMGIHGLDELTDGGISKGELAVVLAPYGVGKTTILTKIANSAYNAGHNVLQIIFEDMPKVIQRKHAACWTGINLNELSDNKEQVFAEVKKRTDRPNQLVIKKFTSEGVNMNTIRTYIRHLISTGIKPDVIILDYIDCVESTKSFNDSWTGEGQVMRAFETMLVEYDMVGWTAVQGNRQSISSDVVTGDQMGGSIKRAQIGHFIISVAKTLPQKEAGTATLAVLKSRFGKDGVIFENCTFNNGTVLIDTTTSDTFLGYEKKTEEKAEDRVRERIKRAKEIKEKTGNNEN